MPQTLLLADDSVTIQRVIELTFADQDIDVVAVSDGDQAIARLDAIPPDIVLVDVGMPGKSGYEVAAYVKQSPRLSHIPVVLLTGAFEPVDEALAAGAGCAGVLAKPFEPQQIGVRSFAPGEGPVGSDAGSRRIAARREAPEHVGRSTITSTSSTRRFRTCRGRRGRRTVVSPEPIGSGRSTARWRLAEPEISNGPDRA